MLWGDKSTCCSPKCCCPVQLVDRGIPLSIVTGNWLELPLSSLLLLLATILNFPWKKQNFWELPGGPSQQPLPELALFLLWQTGLTKTRHHQAHIYTVCLLLNLHLLVSPQPSCLVWKERKLEIRWTRCIIHTVVAKPAPEIQGSVGDKSHPPRDLQLQSLIFTHIKRFFRMFLLDWLALPAWFSWRRAPSFSISQFLCWVHQLRLGAQVMFSSEL